MTAQEQGFLAATRSFLSRAEELLDNANDLSREVHEQTAPRQRKDSVKPVGKANKSLMDARESLLNTVRHLEAELKRLEQ